MNPKGNIANLKSFKPGEGGKPKGAKNKKPLAVQHLCREILQIDPETNAPMSVERFIRYMHTWAREVPAVAKLIIEHAYGKPKETHDVVVRKWQVEGPEGEALTVGKPTLAIESSDDQQD